MRGGAFEIHLERDVGAGGQDRLVLHVPKHLTDEGFENADTLAFIDAQVND